MMVDVVEPLKFLSRHPDIDANKIAITGWSLGGMVAFYAAWEPIMEKLAPNGERFVLTCLFILQLFESG